MNRLIHELAVYEREPNAVEITVDTIRRDGFSESGSKYTSPRFYVCLAVEKSKSEDDNAHETVVGMALFYPIYSTWKGSSIYLEDLIVREPYRGRGIGKSLIHAVGEVTLSAGLARLQWQCLKWNQKPMAFYKSLGAEPLEEWETLRMTKPAMVKTFGGVSLASAFTTINPNAPPASTLPGPSTHSSSSSSKSSSGWGSVFKSAEQLGATLDDNIDKFLKAQKGSRATSAVSDVDMEENSGDEGGFSQPSKLASFVAQHVKK
jgi:GNAT superfamily N-acetyltransferase